MKLSTFLKKRMIWINALFLVFCLVTFENCDDTSGVTSCTGCDAASPYSTPSASTCYATLSDCQAAEGSGCVYCR